MVVLVTVIMVMIVVVVMVMMVMFVIVMMLMFVVMIMVVIMVMIVIVMMMLMVMVMVMMVVVRLLLTIYKNSHMSTCDSALHRILCLKMHARNSKCIKLSCSRISVTSKLYKSRSQHVASRTHSAIYIKSLHYLSPM